MNTTLSRRPQFKEFQSLIEKAIYNQLKTLTNKVVEDATSVISKLSQDEINRVKAVLEEEFGSFEDFVSKTMIDDYLIWTSNFAGQHLIDEAGLDAVFDLRNYDLILRLKDRTNFLIKSVDDTTKQDIAEKIVKGMEEDKNWKQIAKEIRSEFPDISKYRSELITRTETANAVGNMNQEFRTNNGIKYKKWIVSPSNQSDECTANSEAGEIPNDEAFPSGDMDAPLHPNCQCYVESVIPEDFVLNWSGE